METERQIEMDRWFENESWYVTVPDEDNVNGDGWGPLPASELSIIRSRIESPDRSDPLLLGIREWKYSPEWECEFRKKFLAELRMKRKKKG